MLFYDYAKNKKPKIVKRLKLLAVLFALFGLLSAFPSTGVKAETAAQTNTVNIYFFWGEGCPHCSKAKPFLEEIDRSSDAVSLYDYEVYHNKANQKLLQDTVKKLGVNSSGVPLIVIGDEPFVGYSSASEDPIKNRIQECLANGCRDSIASIVGVGSVQNTTPNSSSATVQPGGNASEKVISLPLFGNIHVKDFSLPVLTIIIAALDGFNPCAMWTLLFLISLLLGMQSRRRMWLLGSTFIGTSAFIYFMFLAAWLNIFLFIGYITWVKILIGLVALGAGGYYLYDFYTNKNGTCKVTGNEKRRQVFEKIRHIVHDKSIWLALIGITLLAFAVNMVELVCSAGLPAVYTNILSNSGLSAWQHIAYLLLYILIFMADDLFVFFAAMLTLKMVGLHAGYARYAHLFGGVLMVVLGILLLFAPQLLMFG